MNGNKCPQKIEKALMRRVGGIVIEDDDLNTEYSIEKNELVRTII